MISSHGAAKYYCLEHHHIIFDIDHLISGSNTKVFFMPYGQGTDIVIGDDRGNLRKYKLIINHQFQQNNGDIIMHVNDDNTENEIQEKKTSVEHQHHKEKDRT